jgi:hypothetical protein
MPKPLVTTSHSYNNKNYFNIINNKIRHRETNIKLLLNELIWGTEKIQGKSELKMYFSFGK